MEADYKDKGGKVSEGVDVIYFKDNYNNMNNSNTSANNNINVFHNVNNVPNTSGNVNKTKSNKYQI